MKRRHFREARIDYEKADKLDKKLFDFEKKLKNCINEFADYAEKVGINLADDSSPDDIYTFCDRVSGAFKNAFDDVMSINILDYERELR